MNIPTGTDSLPKAPRPRQPSFRPLGLILRSFLATGRAGEGEVEQGLVAHAPSLPTLETEEAAKAKPLDLLP